MILSFNLLGDKAALDMPMQKKISLKFGGLSARTVQHMADETCRQSAERKRLLDFIRENLSRLQQDSWSVDQLVCEGTQQLGEISWRSKKLGSQIDDLDRATPVAGWISTVQSQMDSLKYELHSYDKALCELRDNAERLKSLLEMQQRRGDEVTKRAGLLSEAEQEATYKELKDLKSHFTSQATRVQQLAHETSLIVKAGHSLEYRATPVLDSKRRQVAQAEESEMRRRHEEQERFYRGRSSGILGNSPW